MYTVFILRPVNKIFTVLCTPLNATSEIPYLNKKQQPTTLSTTEKIFFNKIIFVVEHIAPQTIIKKDNCAF